MKRVLGAALAVLAGAFPAVVRGGETIHYLYDLQNRLVEARRGDQILVRFQYDAEGRLIKKIGRFGIRQYVYAGKRVLAEYDGTGAFRARYHWGADQLISVDRVGEGIRYFVFDGLGSVIALTDENGNVVARYHWDAWGAPMNPTELEASENRIGYTGHRWDEEVGFYNAQARHYDPTHGRFITQDTVAPKLNQPASLNLYAYAYANPTRYWDPDGHEVRVAGQASDVSRFEEKILHPWVGSKEIFDSAFLVKNDAVVLREDGPELTDPGARRLKELVQSNDVYKFYYGRDRQEAVSHVATRNRTERRHLEDGFRFRGRSEGGGTLAHVRGRERAADPEAGAFAYIAMHPDVDVTQKGPGAFEGTPAEGTVASGQGKPVPAYRFFDHEAAEAQEFAKTPPPFDSEEYKKAHAAAGRQEIVLEEARRAPGQTTEGTQAAPAGFAGAELQTRKGQPWRDEEPKK
ncbi:MAG: hypothetical protein JW940_25375 [Polyangiaceae bacterium]|nr:hypothetical protein [Polyangiaceae bacterium]